MSDLRNRVARAINEAHQLHGRSFYSMADAALAEMSAERDALRAENERLREYGQAVVDEYPVSAGTSPGLCGDESGYGSIYRLCTALNAKTPHQV